MSVGRKRAPKFRAGDSVAILYGPQKVAGVVVEDRGPLGVYGRRLYRVRINPGEEDETILEIPEEDMETSEQLATQPEAPGLRQEFDVTYFRPGHSNAWTAIIKQGELHRGVKARGAIGYTTGRWEGQKEDEENHGIVTVLLEYDPSMVEVDPRMPPHASREMIAKARKIADQMFRNRHPGAEIEHEEDEEVGASSP